MEMLLEVVNSAWLLVLSVAVFRLWDHTGIEVEQRTEEDWEPVDLTEEREWELERQEQQRSVWRG